MSPPRDVSPLARHVAAARKPAKAAEQLADEILGYIVDAACNRARGSRPERQMLADTGRARGTLREALRLLESRGVVEVRQGAAGGAFVRKPQPADLGAAITAVLMMEGASMVDVLTAREDMEVAALMRAAHRIEPRDIAVMQDSVDRLREHIADRDRFVVEAGRFHERHQRRGGEPGTAHPQRGASRNADLLAERLPGELSQTRRGRAPGHHRCAANRQRQPRV